MSEADRKQDQIRFPAPERAGLWMFLLLAALTVFRLYYAQLVPLSEDESYYWDWSRRLAWGYFDQGPLVAWLIRCGTWLWGDSPLGVRFSAIMLSLGMSLILYDLMRRMWKDKVLAFWSVTAMNLSLLFSVGAVLMTYDTPQAFFWALGMYFIIRAVFEGRPAFWYPAGAAVGLAVLAKYSAGMLPVLTLCFLVFNPGKRFWLKRKEPWLASILAGLIILPNVLWNAGHLWAAFGNTLRHAGKGEFNFTAFEFIGAQAGLIGPICFGLMVWGLVRAWRMARKGDSLMSFLLWTSLPVLLVFTLLSVQSRMQPNWPAMGYLAAVPAASAALWPLLQRKKLWRRWALAGLATGLIVLVIALFPSPLITALGKPAHNNPWSKLYGWDRLTPLIEKAQKNWPGPKPPLFFSLRYQLAGSVAFYAPDKPRVYTFFTSPSGRLNQYALWSDPRKLMGADGILVSLGKRDDIAGYFQRVELVKSTHLPGPWDGPLHHVSIYYVFGFLGKDKRPPEYLELLDRKPPP